MDRLSMGNAYYTGPMLLTILKRNLSPQEFELIPAKAINQWKNQLILEEEDMFETLMPILTIVKISDIESLFPFIMGLAHLRQASFSAQYFQLKGSCLDFLRPPVSSKTTKNVVFSSKQEGLHIIGELITSNVIGRNDDRYALARMIAHLEMNKIAMKLKKFEAIRKDNSIEKCFHLDDSTRKSLSEKLALFAHQNRQVYTNLNGPTKKKKWITEFVFEGKDHYLIPFFQDEYKRVMASSGPQQEQLHWTKDPFAGVVHLCFYIRTSTCMLMERIPFFHCDSVDLEKKHLKTPCIRSIKPNPAGDETFVFIQELENAINISHKIRGNGKKFVKGALPVDENDVIFNMIETKEVEKIIKNQGLKSSDINIFDSEDLPEDVKPIRIIHSPVYSMSIPAGYAFCEIYQRIMDETKAFMLLPLSHFVKFRSFINELYDFFLPQKENVYTIEYNVFLGVMEDGIKRLKPYLKEPNLFEVGTETVNMQTVQKFYDSLDYSKKFKHFNHYFRLITGSAEKMLMFNASVMRYDLVRLSFFAEFPKVAQFVHNQKSCCDYPMCMMEFVQNDNNTERKARCSNDSLLSSILFTRQKFSIVTNQSISEDSLVPKYEDFPTNDSEDDKITNRPSSSTTSVPAALQPSTQGLSKSQKKKQRRRQAKKNQENMGQVQKGTDIVEDLAEQVRDSTVSSGNESMRWKGEYEKAMKLLEDQKKQSEEAAKVYRKKYAEWKIELEKAKDDSERVPLQEDKLRQELSSYDEQLSTLREVISKIAEFGNFIRWKDELLNKSRMTLEANISQSDDKKFIKMAKNEFELKRSEYEEYADIAIQNIQLLSENPKLETIQKLRTMPEMPIPLETRQERSSCTIC